MTDQITKAMADYPGELKVVMEAAKWKYHEPISAWRDESVEWTRTATDNDAIVAALTWLMIHDDECDWTRILSLGRQLWRHGKPVMAHDLSLLERLLIGVRETLENSPSDGG